MAKRKQQYTVDVEFVLWDGEEEFAMFRHNNGLRGIVRVLDGKAHPASFQNVGNREEAFEKVNAGLALMAKIYARSRIAAKEDA